MAKDMRIVGLNSTYSKDVFVQFMNRGEWAQEIMSYEAFEQMMEKDYPKFWNEYLASGSEESAPAWFFEYGEVDGDAFVFKAEEV